MNGNKVTKKIRKMKYPVKMERINSWHTTHKTKICVFVSNKQIIQLNFKLYKEQVMLWAMKFKM